ncbi:uncharacterized protein LOC128235116 isoform X2 [Mya arenaria]|uniref:uncharacterized protein LOC128235116 isoform X2 n=1 Tax=Mya arenaria TaxID=6604 RepID=UPI0022DF0B45|nr:uncharacterized protein LOC128235116 isoform X2 [Mya arenaria]
MTEEDSEAMSTSSLPNFKSLGMDYMDDDIFASHNDIACSSRMEQMPYLEELQGHKTVVLSGTVTHFKDFNEDARQLLKNGPFEGPKGVFKKLDKFPIVISTETSNYIENEHYQVIRKIDRTMMETCSDNRSQQKFTRQRIKKKEFGSDTLEAILSMQGTCKEIPELLGIMTSQDWVELFWNFEGVTVAELKSSHMPGKLSDKENVDFLKQCLRFGSELERKGICFQYINPWSVFVAENGSQLKFVDFSLAIFAGNKIPSDEWYKKKLIRFPECSSPEICRFIQSQINSPSHEYMDSKSDVFMLALLWICLSAGMHASRDTDRFEFIMKRAKAGKLELGEKGESVMKDILLGMTQCVEQRLSAQDALKQMNECDDRFLMSRKDVPLFGEQAASEVLGRLKSFVQGTIPIENQGVKRPISPNSYANDLAPQTKGLKKENEPQSLKYSNHGDQFDVSLDAGQREGPPLTHEREPHQIESSDEIPEPILENLEILTLKLLGQNPKETQGDGLCSSQNTGNEHPCMEGDEIQISTDSDAKSETKYFMSEEDNPLGNASDQKDEDISYKLRNCLPHLYKKSDSSSGSDMEDVFEQALEEDCPEEILMANMVVFDSVPSEDYTQDRHIQPPDPPPLPADKNGSTGEDHKLQAPSETRLKLERQKSGIEKDNKSSASTVSPFQHHEVPSGDVHTDDGQPSSSTNCSLLESRQIKRVDDNICNDLQ